MGNDQLYDPLARWLLQLASLTDGLSTPPGVEAAVRWRGERKLIFLLNHSGETQIVHLQCQLTNLFDGTSVPVGDVSLPAHEALVLVG
jgi:beta-galactosidase GanA